MYKVFFNFSIFSSNLGETEVVGLAGKALCYCCVYIVAVIHRLSLPRP